MRQRQLSEAFHFTCSCARCMSADATDAALGEIQTMQKSLNDWSAQSRATPKMAERLLKIYRKEGLEGFLDIPYGFAALAYNAVGNSKQAREYSERAIETTLMKDGPWNPNLGMLRDLVRAPEKHWSFGQRRGR